MQRVGVISLVAILAASLQQVRPDGIDDKVAEVKKVDRALTEAHIKRDAKEVDRLTSDEYVHVSPVGKLFTKNQILSGLSDGRLVFEKIDDTDLKVSLYGDTAVMIGLSRMKGKSKSRGEFNEEYRWTRVYVRHAGKWQIVVEQLGHFFPPEGKQSK